MQTKQAREQFNAYKLHQQIEAMIRRSIEERQIKAGGQLPTEADLCRQFGVSRSTVRLALTHLEKAGLITRTPGRGTFVSEANLLPDATRELRTPPHQDPNKGVRVIRASSRHTAGVVMAFAGQENVQHVMQMNILLGIEHAVKSRGYNTLFVRTDEYDDAGEAKAIGELQNAGVGGLVIMPIANHTATSGVRALVEQQVPVVLIDRYLSAMDTSYVVSDNVRGAYRVTEHLISLGYQDFEYVLPLGEGTTAEQLSTTSIRDRYEGFRTALEDYELSARIKEPCVLNVNDPEAVRGLLSTNREGKLPFAIVALHDLIAIPLMNTAAKLGLRPPDDFAIVGFDDLPFAVHLPVPLTTVTQPRYEIGFRAGHLLVDKIEGNPIRNDRLSLMVSTVVRASCGGHHLVHQRLAMPAR